MCSEGLAKRLMVQVLEDTNLMFWMVTKQSGKLHVWGRVDL